MPETWFHTEIPPSGFHRTTFTGSMVRIIVHSVPHPYSLKQYLGYSVAEWANSWNKNWISVPGIWCKLHYWLMVLSLHHLIIFSLINLAAFPASS
jgi:hypothetical protein